jgi:hypothetical protein
VEEEMEPKEIAERQKKKPEKSEANRGFEYIIFDYERYYNAGRQWKRGKGDDDDRTGPVRR